MKNLSFFKFFNEGIYNSNEFAISKVIIKNINHINRLTTEQIAQEANVSSSAITRFIKRAGFDSFSDLKYELQILNQDVKFSRYLYVTKKTMASSDNVYEINYQQALNNLEQTKKNLALDKLTQIVSLMRSGKNVVFVGDTQELSQFYTLQIDLLSYSIPSFLLNVNKLKDYPFDNLNSEHDVVVLLSVYHRWGEKEIRNLLKFLNEKNITVIAFAQEEGYLKENSSIFYQYGIPESYHEGYHSLFYLSRLISEILHFNM